MAPQLGAIAGAVPTCVLGDLHHRGAEGAHEDAHAGLAVFALHTGPELFV